MMSHPLPLLIKSKRTWKYKRIEHLPNGRTKTTWVKEKPTKVMTDTPIPLRPQHELNKPSTSASAPNEPDQHDNRKCAEIGDKITYMEDIKVEECICKQECSDSDVKYEDMETVDTMEENIDPKDSSLSVIKHEDVSDKSKTESTKSCHKETGSNSSTKSHTMSHLAPRNQESLRGKGHKRSGGQEKGEESSKKKRGLGICSQEQLRTVDENLTGKESTYLMVKQLQDSSDDQRQQYRDRAKMIPAPTSQIQDPMVKESSDQGTHRIEINEKAKTKLIELFNAGMNGVGRKHKESITSASAETGLPEIVIKNFIGNHRRKVDGRKYKKTVIHIKGRNAYNQFCAQQAEDGIRDKKVWGEKWAELTDTEKKEFREIAKTQTLDPASRTASIRQHIKMVQNEFNVLSTMGVEVAAVILDGGSSVSQTLGSPEGVNFLQQRNMDTDFQHFLTARQGTLAPLKTPEISHRELVKKVQAMMNSKYASLTGRNTCTAFPYQACKAGGILMDGFPADCLPVRTPSSYGTPKLKAILEHEDSITISWPETRINIGSTKTQQDQPRQTQARHDDSGQTQDQTTTSASSVPKDQENELSM